MRHKLPFSQRAAYWSDIVSHVAGKTLLACATSVVLAALMLDNWGDSRLITIAVSLLGPLLFTPYMAWTSYRSYRDTIELQARLRAMAAIETLPSVLNTASFLNFSERLRSMSIRQRRSLSMMTVEIRHFETISETLGKRRADALIRLFAEQVVKCIRSEADLVCRIKEAKFAVLLIDADFDASQRVAQRMSNAIARADFGGVLMSAGVCVATLETRDKTIEDFLDRTETTPFEGIQSAEAAPQAMGQSATAKAA